MYYTHREPYNGYFFILIVVSAVLTCIMAVRIVASHLFILSYGYVECGRFCLLVAVTGWILFSTRSERHDCMQGAYKKLPKHNTSSILVLRVSTGRLCNPSSSRDLIPKRSLYLGCIMFIQTVCVTCMVFPSLHVCVCGRSLLGKETKTVTALFHDTYMTLFPLSIFSVYWITIIIFVTALEWIIICYL